MKRVKVFFKLRWPGGGITRENETFRVPGDYTREQIRSALVAILEHNHGKKSIAEIMEVREL